MSRVAAVARAVWTLAAMLALCSCVSADPATRAQYIVHQIGTQRAAQSDLVGFTVAVAKDGHVIVEAGFGRQQITAATPMSPDAVLDYFSVGKAVTAALLLRLAERGLVDLDAPVSEVLPHADFHGAAVTARQLLSHTSGLWEPELDETAPPPQLAGPPAPGAVLARANASQRHASPGETWLYSSNGFVLAGVLAEVVTGKAFAALVDEELVTPLGLEHFSHCLDASERRAAGYMLQDGTPQPIPHIDARWFGGAGSICGSAGDLVRWWLSMAGGEVVSQGWFEQMLQPVALTRDGVTARFGYGLGVRLGSMHGRRKIGHTGNGAGGTSVLAAYPDSDWVVAVITNTAGAHVADALEIETEIAAALLGRGQHHIQQPVTPELARSAAGYYLTPTGSFCVTAAADGLHSAAGDAAPVRLQHLGNGRFSGGDPAAIEYFLGQEHGQAQWFGYDWLGFPTDLAMRISDRCPLRQPRGGSAEHASR